MTYNTEGSKIRKRVVEFNVRTDKPPRKQQVAIGVHMKEISALENSKYRHEKGMATTVTARLK